MKRHLSFGLAAIGLWVASGGVYAAPITVSYNIDVNGTLGDEVGTVTPNVGGATDIAGVVPAGYWYNTFDNNTQTFAFSDMIGSDGAGTSIDMTAVGFGLFSVVGAAPGQDADTTWNRNMLNGYSNAGATVSPAVSTMSISDISATLLDGYSIYVYFSSDVAGRTGTVSDGTTTFDFSAVGAASVTGPNALLTPTVSTTGLNPTANYAVFAGLTGDTQTITVDIPDFGGLAGVQIVGEMVIPEPASLGLIGLAGVLLAVRRRRS